MGDDLKLFGIPYILVNGEKQYISCIPELEFNCRCYVRPNRKYIAYRKAKTLARRKNSTRPKRNARRKASGK